MNEHLSKERVFEDDAKGVSRLKYAIGDPIPEDEARRQGLIPRESASKAVTKPPHHKAQTSAENKAPARVLRRRRRKEEK